MTKVGRAREVGLAMFVVEHCNLVREHCEKQQTQAKQNSQGYYVCTVAGACQCTQIFERVSACCIASYMEFRRVQLHCWAVLSTSRTSEFDRYTKSWQVTLVKHAMSKSLSSSRRRCQKELQETYPKADQDFFMETL